MATGNGLPFLIALQTMQGRVIPNMTHQSKTFRCNAWKEWTQLITLIFSCPGGTSGSMLYHLRVQCFKRWAVRKHHYKSWGSGLESGSSTASILNTLWRTSSTLMQRRSVMTFGINQNVGSTCLAIASKKYNNAFVWLTTLHQFTRTGEICWFYFGTIFFNQKSRYYFLYSCYPQELDGPRCGPGVQQPYGGSVWSIMDHLPWWIHGFLHERVLPKLGVC